MDIDKIGLDFEQLSTLCGEKFETHFKELSFNTINTNENPNELYLKLIMDSKNALIVAFAEVIELNNNQIKKDIENLK